MACLLCDARARRPAGSCRQLSELSDVVLVGSVMLGQEVGRLQDVGPWSQKYLTINENQWLGVGCKRLSLCQGEDCAILVLAYPHEPSRRLQPDEPADAGQETPWPNRGLPLGTSRVETVNTLFTLTTSCCVVWPSPSVQKALCFVTEFPAQRTRPRTKGTGPNRSIARRRIFSLAQLAKTQVSCNARPTCSSIDSDDA